MRASQGLANKIVSGATIYNPLPLIHQATFQKQKSARATVGVPDVEQ